MHRKLIFIIVFGAFVILMTTMTNADQSPVVKKWISPIFTTDPKIFSSSTSIAGMHYSYLNLELFSREYRILSPDKRYVAILFVADSSPASLVVFRNRQGIKYPVRLDMVSQTYDDVNTCVWIPHHNHTLLLSTGGADYGRGFLVRWDANHHAVVLRRAKQEEGDGFSVLGISSDGKLLEYIEAAQDEHLHLPRIYLSLK